MRKPIFIIHLPGNTSTDDLKEVYKLIKKQKIENDYYIFIAHNSLNYDIKFEVFSDKKIKPIELEKLKKILK